MIFSVIANFVLVHLPVAIWKILCYLINIACPDLPLHAGFVNLKNDIFVNDGPKQNIWNSCIQLFSVV